MRTDSVYVGHLRSQAFCCMISMGENDTRASNNTTKFVNISLQNGWLDNVHILLYMIIFFVAIHLFRILYNFIYRSFC